MSEENTITNETSSVQDLINQISKVKEDAAVQKEELLNSGLSTHQKIKKKTKDGRVEYYRSERDKALDRIKWDTREKINDLIKHFPIPKTKDELYEFIQFLKVNNEYTYENWYDAKYNECVKTVTRLFPDDALFKEILDEENEKRQAEEKQRQKEEKKKKIKKILIIGGIIFFIIIFLASL